MAPAASRPSLAVHDQGAGYVIAGFGATQIQLWAGTITEAAILATAASHDRIRADGNARVGVFALAESPIPLPAHGVRRTATEIMMRNRAELACNSIVIVGDGFWAGAARSVMATIFLVARPGVPSRVFGDVREAAAWHAEQVGLDTPETLLDAIERLRAEVTAPRST